MSQNQPLNSKDEEFYHLLRKQHKYFKDVMEISKEEKVKLENRQSIKEVQKLIDRKKNLIGNITELDSHLAPLKDHWKKQIDRSGPLAILIGQEIEDLNFLLKEILNIDLISQRTLENHLQLLKDECNKATSDN